MNTQGEFMKNRWIMFALILLIVPLNNSCGWFGSDDDDDDSSDTTDPSETDSTTGGSGSSAASKFIPSNTKISISGTITLEVDDIVVTNTTTSASLISYRADACSFGSYVVKGIGHGGDMITSGTYRDSSFTITNIPQNYETIIEFTCSDGTIQRCLAKPGDTGILCNKIADVLIDTLEFILDKPLYNSSFINKNISKMGTSIVEMNKLDKDTVHSFKTAIKECVSLGRDEKYSCYQTAIIQSPFNAPFNVMKEIASSWTAQGIFTLITDIFGFRIEINDSLYTNLVALLDQTFDTTFIDDTKTLIENIIQAQQNQTSDYPYSIRCALNINGQNLYFASTLEDGSASCDQKQASEILEYYDISISHITEILSQTYEVKETNCSHPDANNGHCWITRPKIFIHSNNEEKDRNDMEGNHKEKHHIPTFSIIEILPKVKTAIIDSGISMNNDEPDIDFNDMDAVAALKEVIDAVKDYFVGSIVVFRILHDSDLKDIKLSLDDIHGIFVNKDLLRMRMAAWGPAYHGAWTQIQINDEIRELLAPPIVTYNSTLEGFQFYKQFYNKNSSQTQITRNQVNTIFDDSEPAYDYTFQMFEQIPNSEDINNYIFNSTHHEEWNPMGTKYLHVARYINTDSPITCKLVNPSKTLGLNFDSTISCDVDYTDVTCTEGDCSFPADYEYPYILQERGWYKEGQGRLFTLISRTTGNKVGDHRGVMIKEYTSSNPADQCDINQINTVIEYIEDYWCTADKLCTELIRAFCMDISDLGNTSRKQFYPGSSLPISIFDESTGKSQSWQIPLVGVYNGQNHKTGACLEVPYGTFIASSNYGNNLASQNIDNDSGEVNLSNVISPDIIDCSENTRSGYIKYYLYQWHDFAANDSMYAYLVNASDDSILTYKHELESDETREDTYAHITLDSIESLLSTGYSVASDVATQIHGMKFVNPQHSSTFDPYCDDINDNDFCESSELTISELPYCPNCETLTTQAETFLSQFGGKAGSELVGVQSWLDTNEFYHIDFRRIITCQFNFLDETQPRAPIWIDWGNWEDSTHEGCPASADAAYSTDSLGSISFMDINPMKNAFTIDKPESLIKLFNYVTKYIGQGKTLSSDQEVFSLDEAMALLTLRFYLPPNEVVVHDLDGKEVKQSHVGFSPVPNLSSPNEAFSTILKGILYKAGKISIDDL